MHDLYISLLLVFCCSSYLRVCLRTRRYIYIQFTIFTTTTSQPPSSSQQPSTQLPSPSPSYPPHRLKTPPRPPSHSVPYPTHQLYTAPTLPWSSQPQPASHSAPTTPWSHPPRPSLPAPLYHQPRSPHRSSMFDFLPRTGLARSL